MERVDYESWGLHSMIITGDTGELDETSPLRQLHRTKAIYKHQRPTILSFLGNRDQDLYYAILRNNYTETTKYR